MTKRQMFIEFCTVMVLIFLGAWIALGDGPTIYLNGLTRSGISFEVLTAKTLEGNGVRRDWKEDKSQSDEWRAKEADYSDVLALFDRGHHAPAGDYGSQRAKDETFLLPNSSPMVKPLNRGLWNRLESRVRKLVTDKAIVQVYTGPCFIPSGDGVIRIKTIGADRIWVGTHFAKAVVVEEDDAAPRSYAWLIPNENPKSVNLDAYRVSINELEFHWGYDCRWGLDADVEERLEKER